MKQIEVAARNHKIKELAVEGKTATEIAKITGIKRERVLQILRSYNIKATRELHPLQCDNAQKIIEELKAGNRQIDIAKKLGVSRQYVNQIYVKIKNL
jgi:DNA-binding CsgD family transcriptional regulator